MTFAHEKEGPSSHDQAPFSFLSLPRVLGTNGWGAPDDDDGEEDGAAEAGRPRGGFLWRPWLSSPTHPQAAERAADCQVERHRNIASLQLYIGSLDLPCSEKNSAVYHAPCEAASLSAAAACFMMGAPLSQNYLSSFFPPLAAASEHNTRVINPGALRLSLAPRERGWRKEGETNARDKFRDFHTQKRNVTNRGLRP